MTSKEQNILLYQFAEKYLYEHLPSEIKSSDLKKYFYPNKVTSLEEVYEHFLMSAQNKRGMSNVIKFNNESPTQKEKIKNIILHCTNSTSYSFSNISSLDFEELYKTFRKEIPSNGKDGKSNSWYQWSRSVVDTAKFLLCFEDFNSFDTYIYLFNGDKEKRTKLLNNISINISGIGAVLASDALKEMGYTQYSKPDKHMKDLCKSLNLSKDDDESVFNYLNQLAIDNEVTPYKADKLLWLICSSYFYLDNPKRPSPRLAEQQKQAFISAAKKKLCTEANGNQFQNENTTSSFKDTNTQNLCSTCGRKLRTSIRFCPYCGTKLN